MAATYKDIHRLTGLSLSTISKYFNGASVREPNRMAIEAAIRQLDFRINGLARGLKSRRSHTIGILIPELNSTFHTTIIADVERLLRKQGYGTIICDCQLDMAVEREALEFLLGKMIDGLITIPCDPDGGHLRLAGERGIPVVLIDRLTPSFRTDAVIIRNQDTAGLAIDELARFGHREMAMICGPEGVYTMQQRLAGFKAALTRHQLPCRPDYVHSVAMTINSGYIAAEKLLSLVHPPSALFCANYELTLGAMMAINGKGVRIPDDISVIGFDNLELAQVIKPRLTMIVQPMQAIATAVADRLLKRLNDVDQKNEPEIIELAAELVRGDSIKKISAKF